MHVSRIALFSVLAALLLIPSAASAQTYFVPVDFGAAYEPEQLNESMIQAAIEDGRFDMNSNSDRDALLNERFPELTLPNVADLEQKFAEGAENYFNGEYDPASTQLNEGLDAAGERLLALSLRPGFAETTWQGGLYLVQIYYFVLGQQDQAEVVMEKLVRLFPTQTPGEDQFPPELIEVYKNYLPSASNGKTITVKVDSGCEAHINGKAVNGNKVSVLPGSYGVTEVCDEQTTRGYVIPVQEDVTIDFHGSFAANWTYPLSYSLNARDRADDTDAIVDDLATLGERLGAKEIVATGLVPDADGADGYHMMLVDVETSKLIRQVTVRPADVSTPEGMKDALNHIRTGEEFKVIEDISQVAGVNWTTGGIITSSVGGGILIGAVVFAMLAKGANDDFFDCNKDQDCRSSKDDENHLKDRSRFSLVADILYGTGAALVVAGVVMIIVDQTSGGGSETAEAGDWALGVAPTDDGGQIGFSIVW